MTKSQMRRLINAIDWEFVEGVRDVMGIRGMLCPNGNMREIAVRLLNDLVAADKYSTSISSGLIKVSRYYGRPGKAEYRIEFICQETSTELLDE